MDRLRRVMEDARQRGPHARGDGPYLTGIGLVTYTRSPRAWGWTVLRPGDARLEREVPTRVGMDRKRRSRSRRRQRGPHARGDGPVRRAIGKDATRRSPRAWGWTVRRAADSRTAREVPTRVGTSRAVRLSAARRTVHPHARGDLRVASLPIARRTGPSPRAWGPLCRLLDLERLFRSIPTRVGTSRSSLASPGRRTVHPHARGDGPEKALKIKETAE